MVALTAFDRFDEEDLVSFDGHVTVDPTSMV